MDLIVMDCKCFGGALDIFRHSTIRILPDASIFLGCHVDNNAKFNWLTSISTIMIPGEWLSG
jgi:hypothetical protein